MFNLMLTDDHIPITSFIRNFSFKTRRAAFCYILFLFKISRLYDFYVNQMMKVSGWQSSQLSEHLNLAFFPQNHIPRRFLSLKAKNKGNKVHLCYFDLYHQTSTQIQFLQIMSIKIEECQFSSKDRDNMLHSLMSGQMSHILLYTHFPQSKLISQFTD